jgi:hypothetical protein
MTDDLEQARMDAIVRKLRVRQERMMRDILYGAQTATVPVVQTSISADDLIDNLRRIALTMPKAETWLSTKRFPPGEQAFRIEASSENFLVAHPSFWMRFQYAVSRDQAPTAPLTGNMLFSGIRITEIDLDGTEDDDRREYLQGVWARLVDAIRVASVELPEWLRSAPKFGQHG